jgi:hypothetical protein
VKIHSLGREGPLMATDIGEEETGSHEEYYRPAQRYDEEPH